MHNLKSIYFFLAGEDRAFIRRCDKYAQGIFCYIRFYVLLIFSGCWVSATAFTYSLFQGNKWMCFPIGAVWALLVTNMYLLLLHTVSPALLPVKKKRLLDKARSYIDVAMFFRLVFMSLLAVIIAQPINVLLLSPYAQESLDKYKTEYRARMMLAADSALIAGECRCGNELVQSETQIVTTDNREAVAKRYAWLHHKISEDSMYMADVKLLLDSLTSWHGRFSDRWKHISDSTRLVLDAKLREEQESDSLFLIQLHELLASSDGGHPYLLHNIVVLQKLIAGKIKNDNRLQRLIDKSNFYMKTNQIILGENPCSWLITILVLALFLLPIYLKYSIRKKSLFYQEKEKIDRQLVSESYQQFKEQYRLAFIASIERYNTQSWKRLMPWLEKLKLVHPEAFVKKKQHLQELFKADVEKYEYWADHPYRTIRKYDAIKLAGEADLLTLIYPEEE
ncbi:hypothetical protein [Filimonas effusa]|uniref:Uncharacterized protein n=1 Tax=Filimonas effusa TaxID=2508721 RepID=A0A4Q1D581_9BACT|nr:hypothetical protein [Filimonas effusa]RXK83650.1 hypothetical protein ESB13_16340 [Filimonas effusa]